MKEKRKRIVRVLALVDSGLVPPDDVEGVDTLEAPWKTEFDVIQTLREEGHEVKVLGVGAELAPIRKAIDEFEPHIAFNMMEAFDNVASFDHNVVAYLELIRMRYTGCNSRGLVLARDKSISKKILHYHRIGVAAFEVFPRGRRVRRPRRLQFPLIVKSLTLDASIGISQASVVGDDEHLFERVRFIHESLETDALVEEYIEGRELYVGLLGNKRLQVLPVWELDFSGMPEEARRIATERLKWSLSYQKKHRIMTGPAKGLSAETLRNITSVCKRVYRCLELSGYARIDLRLRDDGRVFVMEANPNPQLAYGEDFAESAESAGIPYGPLLERIMALGLRWEPRRLG
jgi:D-alanine-D-alanine ligase